jgi:hypothetical protein
MSVSKETTNVDASSANAASVTFTLGSGAGQSIFYQPLLGADLPQLRGRPLSFSIRVRTATPNAVNLAYNDGSGWNYSATTAHPGDGTYRTLTFTFTPIAAATSFHVGVSFKASCTAYIDNAMLVVGSQAADYAPLHPADDLARCLRYYEAFAAASTQYICMAFCYGATNAMGALPSLLPKAVTPTLTISAPNTWGITNSGFGVIAATSIGATVQANRLVSLAAVVASGLVAGNAAFVLANTGQTATLSAEANP